MGLSQWMLTVEWVEEKASKLHTQQVPPEDLLPCIAYFHLLLLPFLVFVLCLLLLLVSLDIDPVLFVLDLHMKYAGGGPSMYVYCVVCYRVIVAPYVRSVGHIFAYLYNLDDDSERPMDYETSLLPKVFPLWS